MSLQTNVSNDTQSAGNGRYIDSNGNATDLNGPDVRKARSIDEMIGHLNRRRTKTYGIAFYQAAHECGLWLSVQYQKDGSESLQMGLPCDSQERIRRHYLDALRDNIHARGWRRDAVVEVLNFLGRFADNRPLDSVLEAARQMLAAGARLMVNTTEELEWTMDYGDRRVMEDSWEGYPLKRLVQRYEATLRQKGAKAEMIELVKQCGQLHTRSGWYVWEGSIQ